MDGFVDVDAYVYFTMIVGDLLCGVVHMNVCRRVGLRLCCGVYFPLMGMRFSSMSLRITICDFCGYFLGV